MTEGHGLYIETAEYHTTGRAEVQNGHSDSRSWIVAVASRVHPFGGHVEKGSKAVVATLNGFKSQLARQSGRAPLNAARCDPRAPSGRSAQACEDSQYARTIWYGRS